ncbi:DUF4129 domain-containing protein [Pedobacter polaris]|uniref:DUF4129 domain-containing protein n=1 Tax=Pedobacter polaris TaxID=2571273 RepID=A0A4U1CVS9_9SPHI|nr:DUF4129 domain-containing protein [Pedobacter polaris]TKC12315.1 DUF4129 domain-containing protein [Pedobacter polaris]
MRLLLLALLLFTCTLGVEATVLQKKRVATKVAVVKKPLILKIDSSKVSLRKFDEQSITDYSKQKEFMYDDVAPKSLSWWDRFWHWIWRIIGELLRGKTSGSIIKYLLIAIVIALIVFAVFKLIGLDYKLLSGKSKTLEVPFEESLENIHEIDFDEQLTAALQSGNYRLVVRLLYLKTLKQLTDKQLIDWQPEKTNQTYVLELANQTYQQDFTILTNQFEYIWYGEFHIDKDTFETIHQSFQQFNQKTA